MLRGIISAKLFRVPGNLNRAAASAAYTESHCEETISEAAKNRPLGNQTAEQLRALGAGKRTACPRTSLAQWNPSLRRRHPEELLAESVQGRLPALVTLKNQRMAASPFGFFRGAVPVMAYDLSLVPQHRHPHPALR